MERGLQWNSADQKDLCQMQASQHICNIYVRKVIMSGSLIWQKNLLENMTRIGMEKSLQLMTLFSETIYLLTN